MCTPPLVGSINLEMHLTTVDFPEPDKPMITNTSPLLISNEALRTAAVQFFLINFSSVSSSELRVSNSLLVAPNTFQILLQLITGSSTLLPAKLVFVTKLPSFCYSTLLEPPPLLECRRKLKPDTLHKTQQLNPHLLKICLKLLELLVLNP